MIKSCVVGFMIFLFSASALAYIPPSYFIVSSIAKRRPSNDIMEFRSRVHKTDKGRIIKDIFFDQETTYNFQNGKMECRAFGPKGSVVFGATRYLKIPPKSESIEVIPLNLLVSSVLFESREVNLTSILQRWGIPIRFEEELLGLQDEAARRAAEVEAFARFDGRFAWVIGVNTPVVPEDVLPPPQVWIEKDSFLFLRILGGKYEIGFSGYRTYSGFSYPGVMTYSLRGESEGFLEEFLAVKQVENNKKTKTPKGFTDEASAIDSDVKGLVEIFYDNVR